MLGRFIGLHIVKSTLCNKSYKRRGFLTFILMFMPVLRFYFFSSCDLNSIDEMTSRDMPFIVSKIFLKDISSKHHVTTQNIRFHLLHIFIT